MHIIAAKAACFLEGQQPEYRSYMQQVVNNAPILAEAIKFRGYRVVSGEPTIICYWWMCFPKASQASRRKRCLRRLA